MNSKKYNLSAFTLVEVSVVIVVTSLILSVVIAARSIIDAAKANKIQEEYRSFNSVINIFTYQYRCMPGDCRDAQISDISASMPPDCFVEVAAGGSTYLSLNTGAIESSAKRLCFFSALKLVGYANLNVMGAGTISPNYNLAGVGFPFAKFSKQASWDYRLIATSAVNPATTRYTLPRGNGLGSLAATFPDGTHELVLKGTPLDLSSTDVSILANVDGSAPNGGVDTPYGVSSKLAQKIDNKFDDGLPYSGIISAGRNATDSLATTAVACTNLAGAEADAIGGIAANITANVNYQNSNSISNGCLVTWAIRN